MTDTTTLPQVQTVEELVKAYYSEMAMIQPDQTELDDFIKKQITFYDLDYQNDSSLSTARYYNDCETELEQVTFRLRNYSRLNHMGRYQKFFRRITVQRVLCEIADQLAEGFTLVAPDERDIHHHFDFSGEAKKYVLKKPEAMQNSEKAAIVEALTLDYQRYIELKNDDRLDEEKAIHWATETHLKQQEEYKSAITSQAKTAAVEAAQAIRKASELSPIDTFLKTHKEFTFDEIKSVVDMTDGELSDYMKKHGYESKRVQVSGNRCTVWSKGDAE